MNHEQPDIESQQSAADAAAAAGVNDEVERLRAEIEQVKADALRERADLENQRKRVARDIEQARKFANEKLLGDLLPVFDSLDAGLKAAGDDAHPLREGLELTYKQLLKVAADNGLVLLDPIGQPFNPEHHQAISQAPTPGAAPGSVVTVFQKGYLLNERLLRPALVVVAAE
ncbi:nucleotide exchange factor GrpE [Stenotrophomonas sp. GD03958]|uniref:nucleotide exchange factor GrpE n=1 Tax=Stenotrophomonas sp. GD03958 TaxID=2975411 RepID=UPI00244B5BF5|nr:nucleotide exchange factor GrpE [Stenotrophomonas sp. GD03958]MDH1192581.1 nucleotide exchange factor GrpE [Stenotrophomonas sp. GD03958]